MSTRFSVGQMNQLGDALELAEFTPEDVTKLRSSIPLLGNIKAVLSGCAEIVTVKHLIDLDATPFIPEAWSVEEHQKGGMFEWDPSKLIPYLSELQEGSKRIKGTQLREELKGKSVLNAVLLDYLLAHPELIPEEWKGKYIFFWGTIYRNSYGYLYVRYLCWDDDRWYWYWRYYWLDDDWDSVLPALVLAST